MTVEYVLEVLYKVEEEEAGPPKDVGKSNGERTRDDGKTGRINKYFIWPLRLF